MPIPHHRQPRACPRIGQRGIERRKCGQHGTLERDRQVGPPVGIVRKLCIAARERDRQRCKRKFVELPGAGDLGLLRRLERAQAVKAPVGPRADDYHAVVIGDEGRPGLRGQDASMRSNSILVTITPSGRWPADPACNEQARPPADGAEREQFGGAARQRVGEIGPEAVVLSDETGRQAVVASCERSAVRGDDVDRGSAGPLRQSFEPAVERQGVAGGCAQQGGNVRIVDQDGGQQAEFLQLAVEQRGVRSGKLACLGIAGVARRAEGPLLARQYGQGQHQQRGDPHDDTRIEFAPCARRHLSPSLDRYEDSMSGNPDTYLPYQPRSSSKNT